MPTGGPFVLSCFENVFGDTNAIFRTQQFRDAGGFETDPHTFIEDWETFVRLAANGLKIDVIPDALFYYRLRGDNRSLAMSRGRTNTYPFVQRMIRRRFVTLNELNPLDSEMLWLGVAAFGNRAMRNPGASAAHAVTEGWQAAPLPLRYRVADKVNSYLKSLTPFHWLCRSLIGLAMRAAGSVRRQPSPATEAGKMADAVFAGQARRSFRWPRLGRAGASRAA